MRTIFYLAALLSIAAGASAQTAAIHTLALVPQGYEPNRGQAGAAVDFTSRGPGYTLSLTAASADLQLLPSAKDSPSANLRLRLVGSDQKARPDAAEPQQGRSNYFLGNNPDRWLTNIPHFGRVQYHGVYPGIDLAYHGDNQLLEYDFLLAPHADPYKIRLAIEGADRVRIDSAGDLVLTVGSAEIRERKPVVYQETGSGRSAITGRFIALTGNQVGFALGSYNPDMPLVIDPVILLSSFFGGPGIDQGLGLTLDANGNIYMCGPVGAGSFPGTNIGTPGFDGADLAAYVIKVSPAGALISSTFIAGANDLATATAIALDGSGNIYLAGNTVSANFPTLNPIQATYGGAGDAFALELNSAGNALVYSTYLGGSNLDAADGIGVDSNGNTLVSGWTGSANFPLLHASQAKLAGVANAFVVKIAPGGGSMAYSTYLGGSGTDYDNGMILDKSGDPIVYGDTTSTNFPVLHAFQPNFCGWTKGQTVSVPHGWVATLGPSGETLSATYICGSIAADSVRGAALDADGNLILTGATASATFPTLNPLQKTFAGGSSDAFVMKLSPAGTLLYSTYLGGSGTDVGRGVVLDSLGNFYVTGNTESVDFPTVNPIQKSNGGGDDAFLTKIMAAGSSIAFSTYVGGSGGDYGLGIAVDSLANAYIAGFTASANFPAVSPFQSTYGGGASDAFLTVISTCGFAFSTPPRFPITGGSGSITVTTTPECGWTATSNSPWIAVKSSPAAGTGSGSVSYTVAPNSGIARTGTLTIGGQTVAIAQAGVPSLSVLETNAAAFSQRQQGATYTVTVSNAAGSNPTSGAVKLIQTLQSGLVLVSMTGPGWSCTGALCGRSDALSGGSSYPPVTVTVNVAANAKSPLTAQVAVTGGNSAKATATDVTNILFVTTLQLTNLGSDAINSTGLQLSGFSGTQTSNCPISLAVNATCQLTLTFSSGTPAAPKVATEP